MNFTYVIILAVVLLISPFVLKIASKQDKKVKQNLKFWLIIIVSAQIILGFLSGLQVFLVISAVQITFLLLNRSFNILVVVLNFINSVVIFAEMINMSKEAGYQILSITAIGAVLLVLIGNVLGLAYINRNKNLTTG